MLGRIEEMMARLDSPDPNQRSLAALALGRAGDERSLGALVPLLGDPANVVREAAATALGELRDRRATAPLAGTLGDAHASVRFQAARALGYLGDPEAVAPLVAALHDAASAVRQAAAEALGNLGSEAGAALTPLRAAVRAGGGDLRWACERALHRIEEALHAAPNELVASESPAGTGTELEAAAGAGNPPELASGDR